MSKARRQEIPPLPLFVQIVCYLELFHYCLLRGIVIALQLAQLNNVANPNAEPDAVLLALAGNLTVAVFGVTGAVAMLAMKRYAPLLQSLSILAGVLVMALGGYTFLSRARPAEFAFALLVFGMMGAIYLAWLAVVGVSIFKGSSLFQLLDGPLEISSESLSSVLISAKFTNLDLSGIPAFRDEHCLLLERQTNLQILSLGHTKITDRGVLNVARIPLLAKLDLARTSVTDECLPILLENARLLVDLRIGDTQCTKAAIDKFTEDLRAARPWCSHTVVSTIAVESPFAGETEEDLRRLERPVQQLPSAPGLSGPQPLGW